MQTDSSKSKPKYGNPKKCKRVTAVTIVILLTYFMTPENIRKAEVC